MAHISEGVIVFDSDGAQSGVLINGTDSPESKTSVEGRSFHQGSDDPTTKKKTDGPEGDVRPSGTKKKCVSTDSLSIICFGQFISFLMAASGAAQSTLELECHLSAPALSVAPLYALLTLGLIPLYRLSWKRREEAAHHKKTDLGKLEQSLATEPDDISHLSEQSDGLFSSNQKDQNNSSLLSNSNHSFLRLIPLSRPAWLYAVAALADFYANYFTVLAFRYTTITSVAVMDALAIPSAMILSCCWLGRHYSTYHLVGVTCCMCGIFLNVYQDYVTDHKPNISSDASNVSEEDYPHKALGDILGTIGGLLFGVSNTLAEFLVRDTSTSSIISSLEYLSLLGFFASIAALLSVWFFEQDRLHNFIFFMGTDKAAELCTPARAFGLWMGYSLPRFLNYVGTARFLQISEAVYYNLGMLTSDFWSVGFSVIAQHIPPAPLFYPSLLFIISGNMVYEMTPSPLELQAEEQEMFSEVLNSNGSNEDDDFRRDIEMHSRGEQTTSIS